MARCWASVVSASVTPASRPGHAARNAKCAEDAGANKPGLTAQQRHDAVGDACQDEGVDGLELNFSCPHMDRDDMGSNIGKSQGLCSVVTQAVKEVAKVPVWCKLTPSTTDIAVEAGAAFRGGADAITSSNTFPSIPPIDPDTLDFEMNVDGFTSSGGLGGPAAGPLGGALEQAGGAG